MFLTPDESVGHLLELKPSILHEEYNLSGYPVEKLRFDNDFLQCDIAQGLIFKGKTSGILHSFTVDVDPV